MNATIIGISGTKNTGKTTLLKEIDSTLLNKYNFKLVYPNKPGTTSDYVHIIAGKNKSGKTIKVAIATAGDYRAQVVNNISEIKNNNGGHIPDFLLSACHVYYNQKSGYEALVQEALSGNHNWCALRMTPLETKKLNTFKKEMVINLILG